MSHDQQQQQQQQRVINIRPLAASAAGASSRDDLSSSSGLGGGSAAGGSSSKGSGQKGSGARSHLDTLFVGVGVLVFMACVWVWSVHRLFIAHIGDEPASSSSKNLNHRLLTLERTE